jgi:hypothetical protein
VTQPEQAASAESALRRRVRPAAGLAIVTGGQTGVDTYAALAALRASLPVHVIFPAGWRQERGPLTAAGRRRLGGATLHELGEPAFEYRTWTCVYVSDAVLLVDPAGGSGCRETARAARALGRPLLEPERGELTGESARDWLGRTGARVLLVAGCRASVLSRAGQDRTARSCVEAAIVGARRRDAELAGER